MAVHELLPEEWCLSMCIAQLSASQHSIATKTADLTPFDGVHVVLPKFSEFICTGGRQPHLNVCGHSRHQRKHWCQHRYQRRQSDE